MAFGQFIEYSMRSIFLEKSKLSISLDQQSEYLYSLFIVFPTWGLPKYMETKVLNTYFYLI